MSSMFGKIEAKELITKVVLSSVNKSAITLLCILSPISHRLSPTTFSRSILKHQPIDRSQLVNPLVNIGLKYS
jgi:hypothetical protein